MRNPARRTQVARLGGAVLLLACLAGAAGEAAPAGGCRVLVVAGLPGTPVQARRMADWARRFQAWFTVKAGVPAADVTVLGAPPNGTAAPAPATATAVLEAVTGLAAAGRPEDQVVLILLGHGSLTDGLPKFLLPGPDLAFAEIAAALEPCRAGNQVVLLLTSASGEAVPAVARERRVVIAATSPGEIAEPVLAEFFLRGLESGAAAGAGEPTPTRDGIITLLEAFHYAALETPRWIRRLRRDGDTDQWVVSGREAVPLFQALCEAPPGGAGGRRLSPRSRADGPDPEIPLATPAKDLASFVGVRVVGEHAGLEDAGTPIATPALTGGEFRPLNGTAPGAPGAWARRVVLGRAELLPGATP